MSAVAYTFSKFMQDEIKKRNFSIREFARHVEMSPSTIARWVKDDSNPKPELAQLIKIAEFTGVGVETLVGLAYPKVADRTKLTPAARLVGANFERLPESIQDAILALIRGVN